MSNKKYASPGLQAPNSNVQNSKQFWSSGHCDLEFVWNLGFGIYPFGLFEGDCQNGTPSYCPIGLAVRMAWDGSICGAKRVTVILYIKACFFYI